MHARVCGPSEEFLNLMPDYLQGVSLERLGELAARALARKEIFLLESEHIAAKPIPVERYVQSIHARVKQEKQLSFSDLAPQGSDVAVVVVVFLALLELYKRSMVNLVQQDSFGDIHISYIEGSGELLLDASDTQEP